MSKDWLVYGVTGYTGKLILEQARKEGLSLLMAGRDEEKLRVLKEQYGFEYICFDLSSRQQIAEILQDVVVLLNCAGPFSQTAKVLMSACLHSKTHYLDITGEIGVFEHGKLLDKSAKEAGILICPGVGFDVVPTDCLAKGIKQRLPDIDSLWLGFSSRSGLSPGTAKTAVEGIAVGGKVCRAGIVTSVPLAYKVRKIDFGDGLKTATTIPWGDVSTATHGTDIANVDVYIPMSDRKVRELRRLEKFRWLFKYKWVIRWMQKKIDRKVTGPDEQTRNSQKTYVWGEGVSLSGDVVTGRAVTENGYDVTKHAAIAISQFVLKNDVPAGFITPGSLMGADFVEKLPGSEQIQWQETRSVVDDLLE